MEDESPHHETNSPKKIHMECTKKMAIECGFYLAFKDMEIKKTFNIF